MTRSKRIYVLDTNVLMHDPTALFKFEEHDVFLPMQVHGGTRQRQERHVRSQPQRAPGQPLPQRTDRSRTAAATSPPASRWCCRTACSCAARTAAGKLYFQTGNFDAGKRFGAVIPDNHILGAILALKESQPGHAGGVRLQGHQPADQGIDRRHHQRGLRERPRARRFQPAVHRRHRTARRFLAAPRQGTALVDRARAARSTRSTRRRATTTGTRTSSCTCPATTKPS